MRGTGFYDWMTRVSPEESALAFRPLPAVNFLNGRDDKYVDALMEEAPAQDRVPFCHYLSNRPLGLGLITAVSLKPPLTSELW